MVMIDMRMVWIIRMMVMIYMMMAMIATVYNLTDKVHAYGHARGEEQR